MTDAPPRRRKRGPRFAEIAAAAGVSPATVDRVLNERDSVSEATRARVIAAAERLGVRRLLPEAGHALLHLDILLPRGGTPFMRRLAGALHDGAAMLDRRVIVHRRSFDGDDGAGLAGMIVRPGYRRAGLIAAAPDRAEVRAALAEAMARGEAAVAAVTELPGLAGLHYVGVDNARAGAAAADLMGRLTPRAGRVAVLGGRRDFRAHRDRQDGFRAALARDFPHLAAEPAAGDTDDDPLRCQRAVRAALAAGGPPLVGVYNSGAGAEGIAQALAAAPGPRVTWIGHEASDEHAGLMRAGRLDMVIDQDPAGQAIAALQTLLFACGAVARPPAVAAAELRVFTRWTLPEA